MGKEKKAERGAVKDLLKYLYVLVRQDSLSSFLLLTIGVLGVGFSLSSIICSKKVIDVATHVVTGRIEWGLIGLALLYTGNIILSILASKIGVHYQTTLYNRLSLHYFSGILHAEWKAQQMYHSGDIMSRVGTDIGDIVQLVVRTFPQFLVTLLKLASAIIYLFILDRRLTLVLMVIIPIVLLVSKLYFKKMRKLSVLIKESQSVVRQYFQESVQNAGIAKALHIEDRMKKELVKKQLALTYKQYQRDSILHQKGAVSGKDLETTNNLYIGGQLSMENMLSTLENLSMQLAQMKEELLDTEYQYIDKESTLITQLKSLTIQLLTEIQAWEINYVLITPIPGKVTFTNYWIENQNILSGDIAFSVIPSSNNKLIGKALLPTERSGKVKVGQKVNIKFSNYPDNEFGIVRGIVRNISLISVKVETKNHYVVEVELPEGLTTTYGKKLPFVSEMEGQADIITDDLSLLERILLPIKKILTESL